MNSLDHALGSVDTGQDGWRRALAAASPLVAGGRLLVALELNASDGPWVRPDEARKISGLARYTQGDRFNGSSVTFMGYDGKWNSTDQVPSRAIQSGLIDRFGNVDPTDAGRTSRYSLAAEMQRSTGRGSLKLSGFALAYRLNLFSNFTYALDDPENGDQFEQADRRLVFGGRASFRQLDTWAGRPVEQTFGVQARHDDVGTLGLYRTAARRRLSTVREDGVNQTSAAVFYQQLYQWNPVVRTSLGLRGDLYRFDVRSSEASNSGTEISGIVSPKAGLVLGPWRSTELYANVGTGFHSNDARGATIRIDPVTGETAQRVTPLARATGAEVGLRSVAIPRVQASVALWTLGLESELVFVGDAGTTDASRPSRRTGVELTVYARPTSWLALDADLSFSRARFTDDDPAGALIPGAVERVASAGVTIDSPETRFFGSARLRSFGSRPLVEDGSVRSAPTRLVNLQAGWKLTQGARLVLDVFNVINTSASDIDYFYVSRLPGEPAEGIADVHTHPALPRAVRVGVRFEF